MAEQIYNSDQTMSAAEEEALVASGEDLLVDDLPEGLIDHLADSAELPVAKKPCFDAGASHSPSPPSTNVTTSPKSAQAYQARSPAPPTAAASSAPPSGPSPSLTAIASAPNVPAGHAAAYASVASGSNPSLGLPTHRLALPGYPPPPPPPNLRRARLIVVSPLLLPQRRRVVMSLLLPEAELEAHRTAIFAGINATLCGFMFEAGTIPPFEQTVGDPLRVYGRLQFSWPSQADATAFRRMFPFSLKLPNSRPVLLKEFVDRFEEFTAAKVAGTPTLSIRNDPMEYAPEDIRAFLLESTEPDGAHWLADLTNFHRAFDPYEGTYFTHLAGLPVATSDDLHFDLIPSEILLEVNKPPMLLNFSCHVCVLCSNNHRAFATRRRQRLTNQNTISIAQLQQANGTQNTFSAFVANFPRSCCHPSLPVCSPLPLVRSPFALQPAFSPPRDSPFPCPSTNLLPPLPRAHLPMSLCPFTPPSPTVLPLLLPTVAHALATPLTNLFVPPPHVTPHLTTHPETTAPPLWTSSPANPLSHLLFLYPHPPAARLSPTHPLTPHRHPLSSLLNPSRFLSPPNHPPPATSQILPTPCDIPPSSHLLVGPPPTHNLTPYHQPPPAPSAPRNQPPTLARTSPSHSPHSPHDTPSPTSLAVGPPFPHEPNPLPHFSPASSPPRRQPSLHTSHYPLKDQAATLLISGLHRPPRDSPPLSTAPSPHSLPHRTQTDHNQPPRPPHSLWLDSRPTPSPPDAPPPSLYLPSLAATTPSRSFPPQTSPLPLPPAPHPTPPLLPYTWILAPVPSPRPSSPPECSLSRRQYFGEPAPTAFRNDPGLIFIGLDEQVKTWTCTLCDFT
ncbi:unnamed protein product [Closterium sp. NIES-65]|nr:unnamed protein product [Closterium sp. NIES-65]